MPLLAYEAGVGQFFEVERQGVWSDIQSLSKLAWCQTVSTHHN